MFTSSLKQLFRRPGKALIFFLLLTAATALLTFAAVSMTETNQRIDAAESQFTTIATVSQVLEPGDKLMFAGQLNFEGAEYVNPPETRPHLLAYNPDLHTTNSQYTFDGIHVVTFTPLEDCGRLEQPVEIEIKEALYNKYNVTATNIVPGYNEQELLPGDVVTMFQGFDLLPLEAGKTYIADLTYFSKLEHSDWTGIEGDAYMPVRSPFSTQFSADGLQLEGELVGRDRPRADEVTEDFWEGRGKDWLAWVEALRYEKTTSPLPVLPTNSLDLLPTFHSRDAYISQGRAITQEEFDSGARVCMMSRELLVRNALRVGDKVRLPMRTALVGFVPSWINQFHFNLSYSFTPLNARGELYDAFFEGEYEIVGEYKQLAEGVNELYYDMIIVPAKSIGGSWDEHIAYFAPMNSMNTSFQIPNGKIAEFNTALHQVVPEAAKLEIIYDDNGYEEIMQSLKDARISAMLLFAVGALATLTVIVLLIYFFVVKERKRTAIERSLGLSKMQCRVSLASGILVLAVPAVMLGSWASWAMSNVEFADEQSPPSRPASNAEPAVVEMSVSEPDENMETAYFSRDYSLWAENENSETDITLDDAAVFTQNIIYFVVPSGVFLCVLILSVLVINHNLRIEPILLLGGQGE